MLSKLKSTITGGSHADKERFMSPRQEPSIAGPQQSVGPKLTVGEQAEQQKAGREGGPIEGYGPRAQTGYAYPAGGVSTGYASSSSSYQGEGYHQHSQGLQPLSSSSSSSLGSEVCGSCGSMGAQQIPPIKSEHSPIVKEVLIPSVREEVTPEIFREREKQEIKFVVQPIKERVLEPTHVETQVEPCLTREATTASREAVDRELALLREREKSGRVVRPAITERVELPPVVHEVVTRRFIEEVQPIVEREIVQASVRKISKPIHEKIIEAPVVNEEVRPVIVRESTATASTMISPTLEEPTKLHHHKPPKPASAYP